MREAEMAAVQVTLERLDPVTVPQRSSNRHRPIGDRVDLELGERWYGARSHMSPNQAIALGTRVGHGPGFVLQRTFAGLVRYVEAYTGHVEFPSMIRAAQA